MKKSTQITIDDIPLPVDQAHFVMEYCLDSNIHRAAAACGIEPERAFNLRADPEVTTQIQRVLQSKMLVQEFDADRVMQELYNIHRLGMQTGKLTVSLQAMKTIGTLGKVDAYAAEKIELKSDRDVVDRLMRVRKRNLEQHEAPVKFNNDDDKPSFL